MNKLDLKLVSFIKKYNISKRVIFMAYYCSILAVACIGFTLLSFGIIPKETIVCLAVASLAGVVLGAVVRGVFGAVVGAWALTIAAVLVFSLVLAKAFAVVVLFAPAFVMVGAVALVFAWLVSSVEIYELYENI